MTIWDLPHQQSACVKHMHPTVNQDVHIRLTEMGFSEGQWVKCIKRTAFNGPIVVQLGDCVYSLEQNIAKHILLS